MKYRMDLPLLFSNPFYILKREIRSRVREWSQDFRGVLLDIGCGSQQIRDLLPPEMTYFGLEFNLEQRPHIGASALALPFQEASLDHLLCIEVLEHLTEPQTALAEMARVLKPGGQLILSTPMSWYLHYEPHDYFRFTKYGLHYLLEKAGFRPLKIDSSGGFLTILAARGIEIVFHTLFKLTTPIKWITGSDKGRWRLAVLMNVPLTLAALALRNLFEPRSSPFVQGWVCLAEKAE